MLLLFCHLLATSTALAGELDVPKAEIPVAGGYVRPFVSAQLRVDAKNRDDGWESSITLRRARVGLKSELADGRFATSVQLNVGPGKGELIDLYGEFRTEGWAVRVGQFTTPFTRYRQQSHRSTLLVDWSIVAGAYGAERQLGVQLADRGEGPWKLAVGVFSGVNARGSNATGLAEAYGNEVANPSSFSGGAPSVSVHPELFARAGWVTPGLDVARTSARARDAAGLGLFLSGAADLRPVHGVDYAARVAPEFLAKAGPVGFTAVGFAGVVETNDSALVLGSWGGVVEGSVALTNTLELAARASTVRATDALRTDVLDTSLNNGRLPVSTIPMPVARDMHELMVGVNYYLGGEQLKVALDGGAIAIDSPSSAASWEPCVRALTQVAF